MVDLFQYGPKDATVQSLTTLGVIAFLSSFLFFFLDLPSLLLESSASFSSAWLPSFLMLLWRIICFGVGVSAIVYMFRMKSGQMFVIMYATKEEKLVHPLGIEKFVTFSSWTLILNTSYFFLAIMFSLSGFVDGTLPEWLLRGMVGVFAMAVGSAFLTSTIVRFIILPGELKKGRNHERQFWFHNQIMHNFCAIFLVGEILLCQPNLAPEFMLFGIYIGLFYALFAYPYAKYSGGYYAYSFIDPRLQYAPFLLSGLAILVSTFYLGVWLMSVLLSKSGFIGAILFIAWVTLIVQFRSELSPEDEIISL